MQIHWYPLKKFSQGPSNSNFLNGKTGKMYYEKYFNMHCSSKSFFLTPLEFL